MGPVPGGTAMQGQLVAKAEQAPDTKPSSKNQSNVVVSQWESYMKMHTREKPYKCRSVTMLNPL